METYSPAPSLGWLSVPSNNFSWFLLGQFTVLSVKLLVGSLRQPVNGTVSLQLNVANVGFHCKQAGVLFLTCNSMFMSSNFAFKLWRQHLAQPRSQWDLKGMLVKHMLWEIHGIFYGLFTTWNPSAKHYFQSWVRRKERNSGAPSKRGKKEVWMTKQTQTDPGGRQVYSLIIFTFQRRVNCSVLNHTLHLGSLPHTVNNKSTLEGRVSDPIGFFHF